MIISNDRQSASDKDAAIRRTSKAEALNVLGMRAVQRGDYAEAVSLFSQAAATDPASGDAQYNLARALKDAGRTVEALAAFRKVVSLHPADADAWYTMGNTCAHAGRTRRSGTCLSPCPRTPPGRCPDVQQSCRGPAGARATG